MRRITTEFVRIFLALLFTYTATNKMLTLRNFEHSLSKFALFKGFSGFLSLAIPVIEAAIVLLLIFPKTLKWGLLSSFLLILIFTIYIAYEINTNSNLPCSCGGIIQYMSWKQHLIFNTVTTIVTSVEIVVHYKKETRTGKLRLPV